MTVYHPMAHTTCVLLGLKLETLTPRIEVCELLGPMRLMRAN
jgi:hypothetical protein